MREVFGSAYDRPEAVVAALVDAVVAGLAKRDTIIDVVRATELRVFDVMRLGAFAEFVCSLTGIADRRDRRPAGGAKAPLPPQRQLLRFTAELLSSPSHHRPRHRRQRSLFSPLRPAMCYNYRYRLGRRIFRQFSDRHTP